MECIFTIIYFIAASKLRFGFETTLLVFIFLAIPVGIVVTGFSSIFAFATVIAGLLLATIFNKYFGNRELFNNKL